MTENYTSFVVSLLVHKIGGGEGGLIRGGRVLILNCSDRRGAYSKGVLIWGFKVPVLIFSSTLFKYWYLTSVNIQLTSVSAYWFSHPHRSGNYSQTIFRPLHSLNHSRSGAHLWKYISNGHSMLFACLKCVKHQYGDHWNYFVQCLLPNSSRKNCVLQQLLITLLYKKLVLFWIWNYWVARFAVVAWMYNKHLRNRKHMPCFYWVIETQVEVWESKKCCGNTSRGRVFSQLFQVLPNFQECFYNSIETRRTCLLFLLENTATKKENNLLTLVIRS